MRVVISLHGIKTRGVWQKDLVPELALARFVPYVLDYGHFGALQLLRPGNLDKQVNWLVQQYDRIKADSGCARPSVIAHSFGTLQVAHLLQKYDHVVFDKVILAAGIVPLDFPWAALLAEQRVMWVVNDYGGKDFWPKVARHVVPHAGDSGAAPFINLHRALHQVEHPHHRHSDYFSQGNFRHNWIPSLLLDKRKMVDALHALIGILAGRGGIQHRDLRCFVLTLEPSTESLKAVAGLHLGTISARELEMAVPLDSVGPETGPAIAFNEAVEIRQFGVEIAQLKDSLGPEAALNPDLAWSISLPIPGPGRDDVPSGVLIVDGRVPAPRWLLENQLLPDDNVYSILTRLRDCLAAY